MEGLAAQAMPFALDGILEKNYRVPHTEAAVPAHAGSTTLVEINARR